MSLVPMRQILDEAAKGGYGVGAFNVNNMEQIQAIMAAAEEVQSPVIVQASRGALKYSQLNYLRHLMLAAVELHPKIPVAMHLDHGNCLATCLLAIELGFTSVMMDGSLDEGGKKPRSYEDNVCVTRKVVEIAHAYGVTVEGELGCLGGIEDGHGAGFSEEEAKKFLTNPDQAEEFVANTGVDALAVAIGTSHGAYKFRRPPTGAVLRMDVIAEIHAKLPGCHLVMHGSSEVSESLQDTVRMYGGYLKPTFGVPVAEVQQGIKHGVRKVNIDTDSRLAMTGAARKLFVCEPAKFDPREWLAPARDAMQAVVQSRIIAFGSTGHAFDYSPITLEDAKALYK